MPALPRSRLERGALSVQHPARQFSGSLPTAQTSSSLAHVTVTPGATLRAYFSRGVVNTHAIASA